MYEIIHVERAKNVFSGVTAAKEQDESQKMPSQVSQMGLCKITLRNRKFWLQVQAERRLAASVDNSSLHRSRSLRPQTDAPETPSPGSGIEIQRQSFPSRWGCTPGEDVILGFLSLPNELFWRDGPRELFWRDGPRELFCQDEPHPRWDQCYPEQQWEHSQWQPDNYYNHNFPGNFESGGNYRGKVPYRGSYWRRPKGNFRQKSYHCGRFHKGSKSSFSKEIGDSCNSSHTSNLISVTTDKKGSDFEKPKAPSGAPKETKQDQRNSAALAKQSDPCQVELETAGLKAEDCHSQTPCVLAVTLSSSVTLENLRPIKEEEEIVPIQTEVQAAEGLSTQTASLPSAEVLSEQQQPSQLTKVKEELVPVAATKQDVTRPSVTNLSSVVEPPAPVKGRKAVPSLGKQKTALFHLKGSQTAEDFSHCSPPLTSVEGPTEQQAPFKIAKYFHSMEKEEPVQLQAAEDLPHQTASLPSSEAPIKEQEPTEITEVSYSVKKEEPLLLEANQPTHDFSSAVLTEVPFLFDTTDDYQSEKTEETELTQMADNHEDGDHNQTSVKPLASGSSGFLTTTSNVHSVPVLVRGKETPSTDFWETPSLHAEHLRGWAPEDYQEPPRCVDKADKCDRKADRDLVPLCTHVAYDKKADTRRVFDGCSCSTKHRYGSDSRHSNTNRAPKELRVQSALRCGRSPPRRGKTPPRRDRSPPRTPPHRGRSPPRSLSRRGRSPPRSLSRRGRSPPRSPLRRGRSPPRSPLRLGWSPLQSTPQSPQQGDWGPPQSPPQPGWSPQRSSPQSPPRRCRSPLRSSPRRDGGSPQSPPRQVCCRFRDLWGSSRRREDNFGNDSCCLCHSKYFRKPAHERCQERDFPSLYSAHKVHHHHSPKGRNKSYRVPHPYSMESPTAGKKKKKLIRSEVTEKMRTTSGKTTKPLKIKKKAKEARALESHDNLSSADKAATPPKATGNLQPVRRKGSELIQVTAGSEDPDFPCQHTRDEIGSSAQSWTPSDRTTAILARKEEIEQAYQQVLLNFAAVATMLLETQPCMTEAMEAALQATLRRFGNYYECKLKDFIDHFDLAEDS
ncbi:uncharacterized protein [Tiliqua scincoides]|uniref:uncharacterized protein n=1 Tax=Tiliqua scincoides TaxID=71010 RepID=UPI003461C8A9